MIGQSTKLAFTNIEEKHAQGELLLDLINHWDKFCYNYRSTNIDGRMYPELLEQIKWANCSTEHMLMKWDEVCDRYNCAGTEALHMFFLGLDHANQLRLLKYAFRNEIEIDV